MARLLDITMRANLLGVTLGGKVTLCYFQWLDYFVLLCVVRLFVLLWVTLCVKLCYFGYLS